MDIVSIQYEVSTGGVKLGGGKPLNVSCPDDPRSAAIRAAQDLVP